MLSLPAIKKQPGQVSHKAALTTRGKRGRPGPAFLLIFKWAALWRPFFVMDIGNKEYYDKSVNPGPPLTARKGRPNAFL
jgi:hypothetical protein